MPVGSAAGLRHDPCQFVHENDVLHMNMYATKVPGVVNLSGSSIRWLRRLVATQQDNRYCGFLL